MKSHNVSEREVFKKKQTKENFILLKTNQKKNLSVENLLIKEFPKILSINWKKSMKWAIILIMGKTFEINLCYF